MTSSGPKSLVCQAWEFCVMAHAGQKRDDGQPYHTHPEEVVGILREHGMEDQEVLAAGYLHDTLEDTSITREQLVEKFGETVAGLVDEMTNLGPPGRTFEEKHRALAEKARHMSDDAKWIKLADRYDNLSKMDVWNENKRRAYARVTVDLLDALRPWPCPELAKRIQDELARRLAGESPE